jgi:hypothetical protein
MTYRQRIALARTAVSARTTAPRTLSRAFPTSAIVSDPVFITITNPIQIRILLLASVATNPGVREPARFLLLQPRKQRLFDRSNLRQLIPEDLLQIVSGAGGGNVSLAE